MLLYDIHTHLFRPDPSVVSFYSRTYNDEVCPLVSSVYYTLSVHPWYLTPENAAQQTDWVRQHVSDAQTIAIGEAGVDKLNGPSLSLQLTVFRQLATMAKEHDLPLIIHNVKATEELLAVHRELKPDNPWILHGFRGKKEQALQLLRHGFYFTFGNRYQTEALHTVPLDHLLIETDTYDGKVAELYERIAADLHLSAGELAETVAQNAKSLFFRR